MKYAIKIILLLMIVCAGLVSAYLAPVFAQDSAYHNFVDQRSQFGIINFWNVASNLLFILFGFIGLVASNRTYSLSSQHKLPRLYGLFFTASILIGFASAYYHLAPSNQTLVLDRLPIVVAFMAFFSIIIAEYISLNAGRLLFLPLLASGMIAVIYWYSTEQLGAGDLRPYVTVQFLPLILIPFILVLFKTGHHSHYIWAILVAYILSKISEHFDASIYKMTGLISGHSLKHLLASFCILFLYFHLIKQIRSTHD